MKSMKMKALAVAMLGLAAGSAFACPSGPAIADGGAWATKTQVSGGTVTVATPGLDSSSCKLGASLGASLVSVATVNDTTPANETRYRFQFLIDADALGSLNALDAVQIFNASATTAYPAVGGRRPIVSVSVAAAAGGAKRLSITASCNNGTTYKCTTTTPNLVAGVNRLEMDVTIGATTAGQAKYWLNAAAGTTEPATTGSIDSLDNTGWVGVDTATLGLSTPTPHYRDNHATQIVYFDSFDSRRQTYIGY